MFSKDFKEFVELLIKNRAEYLIVGGYAVGIHGYPRYTGDPTQENATKILKSVNEFGFSSFKLTEADFTKENNVVQLGFPPLRIDLLTQIDGVTFEECFKNRKEATIEGVTINFIGYHELLKNKKQSGRLADLNDIERLENKDE